MYESVLIPTDGSEHARRAAEHAVSVASAVEGTVHVLSVVDVQAAAGPFDAGGVDDAFVSRLEADSEAAIGAIEAIAEANGPTGVQTAIRRGRPQQAIPEYANSHDVDLVAMGTHGRTGIERYVLGSVTEEVIRSVGMPVLTARATAASRVADGYESVLVPTDGSEYAAEAYEPGIAMARTFGARLHAVNVVDVTDIAPSPDAEPAGSVLDSFETAGETATGEIATAASEAGLEAVTAVREGTPARSLLEYVADQGIDLIVMGTAGRTGPSRYLLGSTTERIIRHADVPVVAVNARDSAD
jgi:nucleotide-binding universal stress UspA family protein